MSAHPATVARYRLVEPVGHGGMAIVYLGRDDHLQRSVAIKLLADNLAADESFRRRFLREAQHAAQLQHPNIVQVYDTGEDAGRPFIVMEYVDGETLAHLLAREGSLQPIRAVELALQVCRGLEHAHRSGVVHRDVKPQNLLLGSDGSVKIADFGIARSARGTRLTETGAFLGTAAYIAPEQAAGEEVTAASDIYALGVVLYEMLAGHIPSTVETVVPAGAQRSLVAPRLRDEAPGVSMELEEVVMCCLDARPQSRPGSAGQLEEMLQDAVELPTRPLLHAPTAPRRADTRPYARGAPPRAPAVAVPPSRPLRLPTRRRDVTFAATAALLTVAAIIALSAGGDEPSAPAKAPAKPALDQARDLARWLREDTP